MSAILGHDSLLILPSELGNFGQVTLPLCATASGCKEVGDNVLGRDSPNNRGKAEPALTEEASHRAWKLDPDLDVEGGRCVEAEEPRP